MPNLCEVCEETQTKYKCPRCEVETCCVACVKKHKDDSGCDGRRDKTAYVPMRDFSDLHLLNDYRFLEETHRKADSAHTDAIKKQSGKEYKLRQLVEIARQKDIQLSLLPEVFTRRKNNQSWWERKSRAITWFLEINFPYAQAQYETKFHEKTPLGDVLKKYIHPNESDPVIRQNLKQYTTRWPQVYVFMKAEKCAKGQNRYHELDLNKTVLQNLKKKHVIEYPILYVVLEEEVNKYRTDVNLGSEVNKKAIERSESKADTTVEMKQDQNLGCDQEKKLEVTNEVKSEVELEGVQNQDALVESKQSEVKTEVTDNGKHESAKGVIEAGQLSNGQQESKLKQEFDFDSAEVTKTMLTTDRLLAIAKEIVVGSGEIFKRKLPCEEATTETKTDKDDVAPNVTKEQKQPEDSIPRAKELLCEIKGINSNMMEILSEFKTNATSCYESMLEMNEYITDDANKEAVLELQNNSEDFCRESSDLEEKLSDFKKFMTRVFPRTEECNLKDSSDTSEIQRSEEKDLNVDAGSSSSSDHNHLSARKRKLDDAEESYAVKDIKLEQE